MIRLFVISMDIPGDLFVFRSSSILLLERICVRDLVVATDLSAPEHMDSVPEIFVAATSVIAPEEDDIELIPESSCVDAKLCEVRSSMCS